MFTHVEQKRTLVCNRSRRALSSSTVNSTDLILSLDIYILYACNRCLDDDTGSGRARSRLLKGLDHYIFCMFIPYTYTTVVVLAGACSTDLTPMILIMKFLCLSLDAAMMHGDCTTD